MRCERCWIYLTFRYGCRTTWFEEQDTEIQIRKLLRAEADALERGDKEVEQCARERYEELRKKL